MRVGGATIGNNVMNVDTSSVQFSPLLFGDEGDYYCSATAADVTVQSNTVTVSGES